MKRANYIIWLDNNVNDVTMVDKPWLGHIRDGEYSDYYISNPSNINESCCMYEGIEKYDKVTVSIDPTTNRYYVNNFINDLIDESYDTSMPILPCMRDKLERLIYKYSSHSKPHTYINKVVKPRIQFSSNIVWSNII